MSELKKLSTKNNVVLSFSDSVKVGFGLAVGFFIFYIFIVPFILCGMLALFNAYSPLLTAIFD